MFGWPSATVSRHGAMQRGTRMSQPRSTALFGLAAREDGRATHERATATSPDVRVVLRKYTLTPLQLPSSSTPWPFRERPRRTLFLVSSTATLCTHSSSLFLALRSRSLPFRSVVMGQAVSKSKSKSKPKSNPRPQITATFPGDPDHGQVVVQTTAVPTKVARPRMLRKRIKCFLDVSIDGTPAGRIIINLRADIQPRTCENFRALCTGEHELSYQFCKFHRIVPGFVLQTGDVELKTKSKEGRGGRSIYGRSFADENLHKLSHDQYGVLSMANAGPHTNNSQFMIVVDPKGTEWLDGKHTVFGQVAKESFPVLTAIEECAQVFDRDDKQRARIIKTCQITDCGQL